MKTQRLNSKPLKTTTRSHHNSLSCEKTKKQNQFPSHIFQNARNSLCGGSPKISSRMSNNDKYKSYIQFMESGKITPSQLPKRNTPSQLAKRNSFAFQKRNTVTPTPRRNSLQNTERKRLSVLSNFRPQTQTNAALTARPKSQDILHNRGNSCSVVSKKIHIKKDLYVKGQVLKNEQKKKSKKSLMDKDKFRIEGKKCVSKQSDIFEKKKDKNRKSINIQNDTIRSTIEADQKLEIEEQKLLAKLFKGIEFHRDLGKGAHALVKSAVDWNNNRKIAIKIYSRSLLKDDDIKNIQREVQILMSLNHENIVKLYEIIESYKTINLVMEYGGGNSLDQFIRSKSEGRLKQDQACKIFSQVLKAVSYCQKMNVVHRDLKPENILLNKHLQVKIIDFGFSLLCPKQKQINSYCGTPTYMAPQVVSKTPHNPYLSDRWSLGILLYTMLNGCCPFKAPTQKELFEKIVNGEYWYLSNVSDGAKQLIEKFLVKNPRQRLPAQEALKSDWVKTLSNEYKAQSNSEQDKRDKYSDKVM